MPACLVDREFYRSSGRVDWGTFLVREAGIALLAALGAVCAFFVYHYVFHLVVLMLLAAGVILGLLGQSAVEKSRCRDRWVAAGGGLFAACLFFLGVYYVDLVWNLGWRASTRFDLIPDLIAWHLKNDVIAGHMNARRDPSVVGNGIFLAAEFLCVACPAMLIPFKHAGRLYCENCGKWGESETTTISFDAGESIVAAIDQEQLNELPEFPTIPTDVSKKNSVPCTLITLEHCPDAAENGCPVYLSLQRFPKNTGRGRVRVKRLEIDQLETLRLMFKIPGLRGGEEADTADPSTSASADDGETTSVG